MIYEAIPGPHPDLEVACFTKNQQFDATGATMKWMLWGGGRMALVVALMLCMPMVVFAQSKEGDYRIRLHSGRIVEGNVTERQDGTLEVTTKHGIMVIVKANEIAELVPLGQVHRPDRTVVTRDPAGASTGAAERARAITDEEIEEILSGIVALVDESEGARDPRDLLAPLPVDEDSVRDMMLKAGYTWKEGVPIEQQDNLLVNEYYVMLYTGARDSARQLLGRLNTVWRWNARYMSMLELPVHQPESKLEIYFFGTYKEFESYSMSRGSPVSPGVLGYYNPEWNRSHFYDLMTWPFIAPLVEQFKNPQIPWRERQYVQNRIRRYVEYGNQGTVQHEIGHHIHFNIGLFPRDGLKREASIPIWLVEGTTMMFEVPPGGGGASLGAMNHERLFQLRQMFGWEPLTPEMWKLFLIDNAYWRGAGGWGEGASYPLGWIMVYYLYREHRPQLAKYVQRVFGREEAMTKTELEAELAECFGVLDKKWFDRFYIFIDRLELKPSLVGPTDEDAARQQNLERRSAGGGRRASRG